MWGKSENASGFFYPVVILLSRDSCIFLNADTEMSCIQGGYSAVCKPRSAGAGTAVWEVFH